MHRVHAALRKEGKWQCKRMRASTYSRRVGCKAVVGVTVCDQAAVLLHREPDVGNGWLGIVQVIIRGIVCECITTKHEGGCGSP